MRLPHLIDQMSRTGKLKRGRGSFFFSFFASFLSRSFRMATVLLRLYHVFNHWRNMTGVLYPYVYTGH